MLYSLKVSVNFLVNKEEIVREDYYNKVQWYFEHSWLHFLERVEFYLKLIKLLIIARINARLSILFEHID